jgi:hypothetical protein
MELIIIEKRMGLPRYIAPKLKGKVVLPEQVFVRTWEDKPVCVDEKMNMERGPRPEPAHQCFDGPWTTYKYLRSTESTNMASSVDNIS